MFNQTLNATDTILAAIESARNNERVQKAVYITATVCAVIVAVTAYLSTALLVWWEDNGDNVKLKAAQFTIKLTHFTKAVYNEGVNSRPAIVSAANKIADKVYFNYITE